MPYTNGANPEGNHDQVVSDIVSMSGDTAGLIDEMGFGHVAAAAFLSMMSADTEKQELRNANSALRGDVDRLEADNAHLTERLMDVHEESRRDSMTGLLNKKAFKEDVNELIAKGEPCAVFLADLMSLKAVNDLIGHAAGDRAITETAAVLDFGFTFMDTLTLLGVSPIVRIGRLGGDEYGVVIGLKGTELTDDQREAAREAATSIEERIERLREDPNANEESLAGIKLNNFMYNAEVLERLQHGDITYQDVVNMMYVAIQDLYQNQYLESSGDLKLGQGIAMGYAIFDPINPESQDLDADILLNRADALMYKDKKLQKEGGLGSYDRRTQRRVEATDRRQNDRRVRNERRTAERRGARERAAQLGEYLIRISRVDLIED